MSAENSNRVAKSGAGFVRSEPLQSAFPFLAGLVTGEGDLPRSTVLLRIVRGSFDPAELGP